MARWDRFMVGLSGGIPLGLEIAERQAQGVERRRRADERKAISDVMTMEAPSRTEAIPTEQAAMLAAETLPAEEQGDLAAWEQDVQAKAGTRNVTYSDRQAHREAVRKRLGAVEGGIDIEKMNAVDEWLDRKDRAEVAQLSSTVLQALRAQDTDGVANALNQLDGYANTGVDREYISTGAQIFSIKKDASGAIIGTPQLVPPGAIQEVALVAAKGPDGLKDAMEIQRLTSAEGRAAAEEERKAKLFPEEERIKKETSPEKARQTQRYVADAGVRAAKAKTKGTTGSTGADAARVRTGISDALNSYRKDWANIMENADYNSPEFAQAQEISIWMGKNGGAAKTLAYKISTATGDFAGGDSMDQAIAVLRAGATVAIDDTGMPYAVYLKRNPETGEMEEVEKDLDVLVSDLKQAGRM